MLLNALSAVLSVVVQHVQVTPLMLAAKNGHSDIVKILLAQKAGFDLQKVWQ